MYHINTPRRGMQSCFDQQVYGLRKRPLLISKDRVSISEKDIRGLTFLLYKGREIKPLSLNIYSIVPIHEDIKQTIVKLGKKPRVK